jgi:hypothetical protein
MYKYGVNALSFLEGKLYEKNEIFVSEKLYTARNLTLLDDKQASPDSEPQAEQVEEEKVQAPKKDANKKGK